MGFAGWRTRIWVGTAVAAVCASLTLSACAAEGDDDPQAPRPSSSPARVDDRRPNLVMVLVDDLGWGDLGSARFNDGHPNRFVDTPALDRLAAEGMTFPNAYGALSCAPSRMSLLTGEYPQRPDHGVYGGADPNTVARRGYDGPPPPLAGIDNRNPTGRSRLDASTVTIPERLAEAGYWNAHVGKFDVTGDSAEITEEHGYDVNVGGSRAGSPRSYTAELKDDSWTYGRRLGPGLDDFAEPYTAEYVEENVAPYESGVSETDALALEGTPKNLTDAVGDATLESVDQGVATGGPFFVSMNHFAVHSPVDPSQARPDLLAKYEQASRPGDGRVPAYQAMVEGVDQTVGRLLDHLAETPDPRSPGDPLSDNTIVVVTSDNGGRVSANGTSERVIGADNGPLRGEKLQLWEGGIRVPTAAWSGNPRLVRPGVVNRSIVHVTDLAATLADEGRVPRSDRTDLDGQSLRRAFARGAEVSAPLLQHAPAYNLGKGRDQRPETVMRTGSWKVSFTYETQRLRLYDVAADPSETTDLASSRPRRAYRLGLAMAQELERLDTPLATLRRRSAPMNIRVPAGSVTYADREVTRHRRATVLRVGAGDEMPLVVPPGRT